MSNTAGAAEAAAVPRLRVVRGEPSAAELAALTTVLVQRAQASSRAGAESRRSAPASRWNDRSRQLRGPLPRGADAWRAALR